MLPALPGGQHAPSTAPASCSCTLCHSMAPKSHWELSPWFTQCSKTSVAAPDRVTRGAQGKRNAKKAPLIHISPKYLGWFADSLCSLACSKLKIKLLENNDR